MKKYLALMLSIVMVLGSMAGMLTVSAEEIVLPDAPVFKTTFEVGEKIANRSKWSVSASSAFPACPAGQMLDGNAGTYWHSFYTAEGSEITYKDNPPFTLVFDLATVVTMSGISYLPRQDAFAGNWLDFDVYTSTNGSSYNRVAKGTSAMSKDEVVVGFGRNIDARFIKIVINNTGGWGYAAEFNVHGPVDASKKKVELTTTVADATPASGKFIMNVGKKAATLNGEALTLDYAPFIEAGATMLPLKSVMTALGGTVTEEGNDITVTYGGIDYKLKNNSTYLTVGGIRVLLTKPTYKVSGTTMVSLLFLKDILKLNMELNQAEQAIVVTL